MKYKQWKIVVGLVLAFSACHAVAEAQEGDKFDFIVGLGFVIAPEYGDYVDDVYNAAGYLSLDDTAGWIDLYLGVEYRPVEQFGILVGSDLLFNGGGDATSIGGVGGIDETYVNAILLPSIYGQFYFTQSRTFYINGGINFPIPETGSDFFGWESDGVGFGANIGVEIADVVRIEGGYVSIPIKTEVTANNPVATGYDFGGAQLRVLLAF